MNISALSKTNLSVSMRPSDAALLLEGLEALRKELGPIAEELIAFLRGHGIAPPTPPDHVRTEYAGPQ